MSDTRYGTHEWEWDPSHFPQPLTPAFRSAYVPWMERAFRIAFAEFGVLAETVQGRTHHGYLYSQVKPVGLARTPPAWVAAAALRLWWLHPLIARRVRLAVRRVREDHSTAALRRWETRWRGQIVAEQRAIRAVPLVELSDAALADHIEMLTRRVADWVAVHFVLHIAIALPITELQTFIEHAPALRGTVRVADLLDGSRASSAPARALRPLAAMLAPWPELRARAATLSPSDALAYLAASIPALGDALASYLATFGGGVGRYEFVVPTLAEQPESLVPSLLALATLPSDAAVVRRTEETAAQLRDQNAEATFRSLLFRARRAYAVRDDNVQLTFSEAFGLMRRALRESGRRCASVGVVRRADDVFCLTLAEIVAALRGRSNGLAERAVQRAAQWQVATSETPPRGYGPPTPPLRLDGLPPAARLVSESVIRYMREIMAMPDVSVPDDATRNLLRGVGAVRGRYTGVARVLTGAADFDRFQHGDVLVCSMTSPVWAAVLPVAGALVTDHGGALSHAAVIAREFGIPAVVATGSATTQIRDGQTVEVDGDAGTVRVLRG